MNLKLKNAKDKGEKDCVLYIRELFYEFPDKVEQKLRKAV